MIGIEAREEIAARLGISKCDHCARLCPYCPRLLEARPDLAPDPPRAEPGLMRKAAGFGKAILTHAIAGLPQVDQATFDARVATCWACPSFDSTRSVCLVCGCHLDVKLRWADQACPIGRWGRVEAEAVV